MGFITVAASFHAWTSGVLGPGVAECSGPDQIQARVLIGCSELIRGINQRQLIDTPNHFTARSGSPHEFGTLG